MCVGISNNVVTYSQTTFFFFFFFLLFFFSYLCVLFLFNKVFVEGKVLFIIITNSESYIITIVGIVNDLRLVLHPYHEPQQIIYSTPLYTFCVINSRQVTLLLCQCLLISNMDLMTLQSCKHKHIRILSSQFS